jgi:hypothetical protein
LLKLIFTSWTLGIYQVRVLFCLYLKSENYEYIYYLNKKFLFIFKTRKSEICII